MLSTATPIRLNLFPQRSVDVQLNGTTFQQQQAVQLLPWPQMQTQILGKIKPDSRMLMLFLLKPPTKPCHHDITMHALYFFSRGKGNTLSVLPAMKKEGKGKWTIGPRMKNG